MKMNLVYARPSGHQSGAVLIVALIMLASLSLMASSAMQTSLLELRMALNNEESVNAFQTAQSVIDFTLTSTDLLPMTGALNVARAVPVSGTPFAIDEAAGETLTATAERTHDCGAPPRLGAGSSLVAYSAFSFRLAAEIDRAANGRGHASIRQGYLILGPKC